jgi:type I restriction enzyme S subunit
MPTTDALDSKSTTAHPRYDEYEESGADWLGEIPAHWERIRLKFLADFTGGGTPSKDNQEYWDGSIPWVSPKDMKAGRVTETQDYITPEAVVESSTKLVDPGSVLIVVRSGILKHTIPVATNEVEVAFNQDLKAITPDDSLRSRYLAYLIEGRNDTLLLKWTKSGTTVESLEQRRISNTEIPVPPPEEQHAITTYLDRKTERIDALIEKKKQLIDLLKEKRKSLISRVVTKGLDDDVEMQDSGVEWLGEIPAHWDSTQLRRLWDVIDCKHRTADYVDNGIPILSTTEVKPARVDLSGARQTTAEEFRDLAEGKRQPQQGDIIYSRNASIGSAAYVDTEEPFCMGQDVCLIRSEDQDQLYLSYQLNSPVIHQQLEVEAVGATFQRINVSQIDRLEVAVPPPSEQKEIANYLDEKTAQIDALTKRTQDGIKRLREYRTALISAAVTGQIDVRETTGQPVGHQNS